MEFVDLKHIRERNAKANDSSMEQAMDTASDATDIVSFAGYLNHNPDIDLTEVVDFNSYANNVTDTGDPEPVMHPQPDYFETDYFRKPCDVQPPRDSHADDLEATAYVAFHAPKPAPVKKIPARPIVGWLICVEGPDIGKDYRIYSQYNYIGRAEHMDICLSGDPCISAERAAIIAYDPRKNSFTFAAGTGHNLIYINDDVLMNSVSLNPYDQLTIGETKLLFIPLCGERFTWNTK